MNLEGVNLINCDNTNCYIIRGADGDILIDTGIPKYRDEIETWLLNYNVKLIALTHGHNDHIGNAAYFSELYDVPIAMSRYDIKLAENNLCRPFYTVGISGKVSKLISKKSMSKQAECFAVDYLIGDGDVIGREAGVEVKVVSLQGHTKGSIGFLYNGDLYVGDAVSNHIQPCFPYMCESPKEARKSIEKIHTIRPKRIFFGHGEPLATEHNPKYMNLFRKNILM